MRNECANPGLNAQWIWRLAPMPRTRLRRATTAPKDCAHPTDGTRAHRARIPAFPQEAVRMKLWTLQDSPRCAGRRYQFTLDESTRPHRPSRADHSPCRAPSDVTAHMPGNCGRSARSQVAAAGVSILRTSKLLVAFHSRRSTTRLSPPSAPGPGSPSSPWITPPPRWSTPMPTSPSPSRPGRSSLRRLPAARHRSQPRAAISFRLPAGPG